MWIVLTIINFFVNQLLYINIGCFLSISASNLDLHLCVNVRLNVFGEVLRFWTKKDRVSIIIIYDNIIDMFTVVIFYKHRSIYIFELLFERINSLPFDLIWNKKICQIYNCIRSFISSCSCSGLIFIHNRNLC